MQPSAETVKRGGGVVSEEGENLRGLARPCCPAEAWRRSSSQLLLPAGEPPQQLYVLLVGWHVSQTILRFVRRTLSSKGLKCREVLHLGADEMRYWYSRFTEGKTEARRAECRG